MGYMFIQPELKPFLCWSLQIFVTMATGVGRSWQRCLTILNWLTLKPPMGAGTWVVCHIQPEL